MGPVFVMCYPGSSIIRIATYPMLLPIACVVAVIIIVRLYRCYDFTVYVPIVTRILYTNPLKLPPVTLTVPEDIGVEPTLY